MLTTIVSVIFLNAVDCSSGACDSFMVTSLFITVRTTDNMKAGPQRIICVRSIFLSWLSKGMANLNKEVENWGCNAEIEGGGGATINFSHDLSKCGMGNCAIYRNTWSRIEHLLQNNLDEQQRCVSLMAIFALRGDGRKHWIQHKTWKLADSQGGPHQMPNLNMYNRDTHRHKLQATIEKNKLKNKHWK